MRRHELSDDEWAKIALLLPPSRGRPAERGDRDFINAVLWIAKTGAPWRDLPARFGPWKTVYNRFHRWSNRDVWRQIFRAAAVSALGLHGTPEPSKIGVTQSHGCVRLTNWDAIRLVALVQPGTRVIFRP